MIEEKQSGKKLVDLAQECGRYGAKLETLPLSLRVLLENALRREDGESAERIVCRKVEIGRAHV